MEPRPTGGSTFRRPASLRPFRLERYFESREFATPHVLCASDCESLRIADLLALEPAETKQELLDLSLGYTETAGATQLRESISELYESARPAEITVHAGGEEAIFTFMHAALAPGDHVIVHHPSYQSLSEVPRSIGCDVTYWQARHDAQWALDIDDLRSALRRRTRAVVVNFPHNPTGYLPSREHWLRIVSTVAGHGALLFADEAYRGLEYSADHKLPAACDLYEGAVSLGLLSKGFGLPGLRIAWLATRDKLLLRRIAEIKDYTTICSSAPSEALATIALRHRRTIVERNQSIIQANLARLTRFLDARADRVEWVRPAAGPVVFPRLRGNRDIDRMCDEIQRQLGVLLLPGSVFSRPSRHFRVGLGRHGMGEALAQLAQHRAFTR